MKTNSLQKPYAWKLLAVTLVLAGSMAGACAQSEFAYAGAGIGTQNYPSTLNGVSTSGSATSGNIFVGYQFTENFAAELGYSDLGSVSGGVGQIDSYGVYLDAIGKLPVTDKWSLSGRLGATYMNANTPAGNDSGSGLKFGLGADYAISRLLMVGGEWDRYQFNVFGASPNMDQFTVNLKLKF